MTRFTVASAVILSIIPFVGCVRKSDREAKTNKQTGASTGEVARAVELARGAVARARADELATGVRLYNEGKYSEAIRHLEHGIEWPWKHDVKGSFLTVIGNCYYELGQSDVSLDWHQRAIDEDPTNHKAYVNKGIVFRSRGEYDKANECYATALSLAPDYAELHASMGVLAIAQGKPEVAIEQLERCIELDDSLAVGHANLAVAYAMVGRFDEADEQLTGAIVRGYKDGKVLKQRIEKLREAGDSEDR